ncbi:MAG: histidinol-phosphate transaminase, partial [Propionibacteriaceae bacterium]|nr:histidinol-phosphate transaminase [Propionibacteriaceae bacterium]
MSLKYRADLDAIAAYRPGPPAPERATPTYKLSSNENPYPPLPSVQQAIAERIGSVNRYPNLAATELVQALAADCGVTPDEVVVGAGSVEVASAIIRAVAGRGDEVVFAWRSFEAYPQLVVAAGATPVRVALTPELGHDFFGLTTALSERTRCVFVCNPNNPTGTVCRAAELDDFLTRVPADVTVVLDEAYYQFDVDPASPDGLDFYARYPNIVVCRTFSKAYGLAGLRVGYALAPAELADEIRKVLVPFGVTDLAQHAALASLAAEAELDHRVQELVLRRSQVEIALRNQGWRLPPSQANFIWLPTGARTEAAAALLDRHGLTAR